VFKSEAEFKEFEPRLKFETRFKPLKTIFSVSRFEPALKLEPVLAVQLRGLNSLNSVSKFVIKFFFFNSV